MSSIEPTMIEIASGLATIRVAQPADAAATVALRVALAEETDFLSGEVDEIKTNTEELASFLGKRLLSPVDLYILAELDGRIVGLGSLDGSALKRFAHGASLGLAVSRELWGQGLGTALVQALLSWADAQGLTRIALEVVETNLRAIRLYEGLGFEHEGRLRCRRRQGGVYLDNHMMARIRGERSSAG